MKYTAKEMSRNIFEDQIDFQKVFKENPGHSADCTVTSMRVLRKDLDDTPFKESKDDSGAPIKNDVVWSSKPCVVFGKGQGMIIANMNGCYPDNTIEANKAHRYIKESIETGRPVMCKKDKTTGKYPWYYGCTFALAADFDEKTLKTFKDMTKVVYPGTTTHASRKKKHEAKAAKAIGDIIASSFNSAAFSVNTAKRIIDSGLASATDIASIRNIIAEEFNKENSK